MKKVILLLEDQDTTRRSLANLLRAEGYHLMVARNALEAQALCSVQEPDVALVDIELPGLQGNEWALYLKDMSPETRIIFVSGKPGLAGMDRYGPDVHFLHKPFNPAELLALLEEAPVVSGGTASVAATQASH